MRARPAALKVRGPPRRTRFAQARPVHSTGQHTAAPRGGCLRALRNAPGADRRSSPCSLRVRAAGSPKPRPVAASPVGAPCHSQARGVVAPSTMGMRVRSGARALRLSACGSLLSGSQQPARLAQLRTSLIVRLTPALHSRRPPSARLRSGSAAPVGRAARRTRAVRHSVTSDGAASVRSGAQRANYQWVIPRFPRRYRSGPRPSLRRPA